MTKVESIEHLNELCKNSKSEFFMKLGPFRSSKHIEYNPKNNTWWIYNEIDDTEEELDDKELLNNTNIGDAIKKGVFYCYD